MSVQPKYERFDAGVVLRDALRQYASGDVRLVRDADYVPDDLVTVVQVPRVAPSGVLPSNRWAFDVQCALVTTGPDVDSVLGELEGLCDGLLSHNVQDGVVIHTVSVDSEPLLATPHSPSGAVSASASFSLILRRKEQQYG